MAAKPIPIASLRAVYDRAADDVENYSFPADDYGSAAEARLARMTAKRELREVREWLASLPKPA